MSCVSSVDLAQLNRGLGYTLPCSKEQLQNLNYLSVLMKKRQLLGWISLPAPTPKPVEDHFPLAGDANVHLNVWLMQRCCGFSAH